MKQEWSLLQEVSLEDIKSGWIGLHQDAKLAINLGTEYVSPRGANELIKVIEQREVAVSDVDVFRVDSPDLGRVSTGSGDVYKRATGIQKQQEFGSNEVCEGFSPEYIVVSAPVKELERFDLGKASIQDTVEQLQAAQDTIRDVDEPIDFSGRILLENRPNSIFSSVEDLRQFQDEASKQGFDLTYSFNTAIRNGEEMLEEASPHEVQLVRVNEEG